jgi:hypothetical protein
MDKLAEEEFWRAGIRKSSALSRASAGMRTQMMSTRMDPNDPDFVSKFGLALPFIKEEPAVPNSNARLDTASMFDIFPCN